MSNAAHEARLSRILLELRGPRIRLFKLRQGAARGHGHFVRFGLVKGASDILGFLAPNARLVAIEVKTGAGRLTEEQADWLRIVREFGGVAVEARTFEDAATAVNEALK